MKMWIVLVLSLLVCCSFAKTSKYADVKISKIIKVYDGDSFTCDIDEYPPIVGKNIRVRIKGIDTPEIKSSSTEKQKLAILERERLKAILENGKIIELRNIGRCKYFRLLADIYVDGENIIKKLNPQYLLDN